ncbi:MAG TPA: inositol monophosphatase family protein [Spirochaetia bacterium]|nr:inositol monophosphatase family protein [Spirochaetia bacterium]
MKTEGTIGVGLDAAVAAVRSTAIEAATAAGELLRARFHSSLQVDAVEAHDLKLRLDRECEDAVVGAIRRRFPSHGVLSEEMGYSPGTDPYLWIVDPLDGTVNFFHGIPFFCTCVSCHAIEAGNGTSDTLRLPDGRKIGSTVAAVIYAPQEKELFVATPRGGAFMNGTRLLVTSVSRLSDAIVSISFGVRDGSVAFVSKLLPSITERAQKIRSLGSTALEIVNVAAGRTGAFLQKGTNLWDFVAAATILREAGGVVDVMEIAPGRFRIIASNPGLYGEIRELAEE